MSYAVISTCDRCGKEDSRDAGVHGHNINITDLHQNTTTFETSGDPAPSGWAELVTDNEDVTNALVCGSCVKSWQDFVAGKNVKKT